MRGTMCNKDCDSSVLRFEVTRLGLIGTVTATSIMAASSCVIASQVLFQQDCQVPALGLAPFSSIDPARRSRLKIRSTRARYPHPRASTSHRNVRHLRGASDGEQSSAASREARYHRDRHHLGRS